MIDHAIAQDELVQEPETLRRRLADLENELAESRRSEAEFRLAAEALPTAMVVVNDRGRIVLVNAQTEKLFGYSRDELLGQQVELLVPERFRGSHPENRGRFFAEPEVREMGHGRDLFGRRKDGSEVPVEVGLNPIRMESEVLVLAAIVDISERKHSEAAVRLAHEELEQRVIERTAELQAANKELEAFSYSVSHDLRAPLRAIDGFSRILERECAGKLPGEAQEHLRAICNNALQMGRLIDDLLAFCRLGRQPIRRQAVNAASLVRNCLDELKSERDGRRIEFRLERLPDCAADPALLKQVWLNLLSNALKYTSKRDTAVIEIGSCDGDAPGGQTYFVRDNGVGFDMRYAQKLFGVFERMHRAEEYAGTGVGLAIVQRVVQRHGGRVWADSQPNVGSTFYFTLAAG